MIKLPEILYNRYKDIDLIINNLSIIIIVYNSENSDSKLEDVKDTDANVDDNVSRETLSEEQ